MEPETNKMKITKKSIKHLENIEFEITNDVGITFVDEGFILVIHFISEVGNWFLLFSFNTVLLRQLDIIFMY